MEDHPLVIVRWNDAHTYPDQRKVIDIEHKPIEVITVGWLLQNDDMGVSIANERVEDEYRGHTFIVRSLVLSVKPVKRPRKPRTAPAPAPATL